MKKLVILLIALSIPSITFTQTEAYLFHIDIKGQGDPILLIPGLASSGSVWEKTVDILKKDYECHILTLAGFADQKPMSLENGYLPVIEKELITYIQKKLHKKPIVIGHSLGGFLALSIASSEPDLLKEIIIVDSYPFMAAANNPNASVENILPQAKRTRDMIISTSDSIFIQQQNITMPTMITDPEHINTAIAWSLQSDRETVAQAMFELMTTDLRKEVEKVKIPILVLGSWYGAKDYGITKKMVQTNYENQFLQAANCKIEMAETAKHFIMWDEPTWFINSVKSFITNEE